MKALVCYLPHPSISKDNANFKPDNFLYHAKSYPIIVNFFKILFLSLFVFLVHKTQMHHCIFFS